MNEWRWELMTGSCCLFVNTWLEQNTWSVRPGPSDLVLPTWWPSFKLSLTWTFSSKLFSSVAFYVTAVSQRRPTRTRVQVEMIGRWFTWVRCWRLTSLECPVFLTVVGRLLLADCGTFKYPEDSPSEVSFSRRRSGPHSSSSGSQPGDSQSLIRTRNHPEEHPAGLFIVSSLVDL